MKTVRIQASQFGLVLKHGGYNRLLTAGTHWLWANETAHVYNQGTLLENPPVDLAVLLAQPEVVAVLNVVEVGDNELALQYERGLFQRLLGRGRWAYWTGVRQFSYLKVDLTQLTIPAEVNLAALMPQPLANYVRTFAVEGHEKGVLFIDWTFSRVLDAGTYYWWKNNTPIHVLKVDTRQQQMEISGQELLTKDKATLRVSFYVQYRVQDVLKAVVDNKDYDKQLYVLILLSHSGSRGFGAGVAGYYSKLAMQKTQLPRQAAHLAWLDLNTEEGQEYWIGMNLAGEYASANHHEIHNKIAQALKEEPVARLENHHNFAWKETLADGREVIVHRKGATPAGADVLGIIPGSMTDPGFVVRGRGNADALSSASHGAGRLMSRTRAFDSVTQAKLDRVLKQAGVTLIGGDLDEAPMVYKNIESVIGAQHDLVTVVAKFTPKIVRMADPNRKEGRED